MEYARYNTREKRANSDGWNVKKPRRNHRVEPPAVIPAPENLTAISSRNAKNKKGYAKERKSFNGICLQLTRARIPNKEKNVCF